MKENYIEINKNVIPENVPEDLCFVWNKYDLARITEEFKHRFAQTESKNTIQEKFSQLDVTTAENLSREETFNLYGIEENELKDLYPTLEKMAHDIGVSLEYMDFMNFSEDEHYGNEHEEGHETHAETARSDGKLLALEKDLVAAGGIQGRTYDLIHLAFGHMVQWASDDSKLLLTKEEAWSIGYRNHDKSPDRVLDMMSLYEFEAGMQGIEALRQALDTVSLSEEKKESIVQYFTDYVYADRDYIIQHYRGNHESFQKFWKFGQPIPPRQMLPEVGEFIKRNPVEIGLIRDK